MQENEETFEFVDRRFRREESGMENEAPQGAAEGTSQGAEEQKRTADAGERHPRLAALDRLLMCMDILHQGAWIALGLVADPVTNKIERDLNEARALIDAAGAIADATEPLADDDIKRELRNLVATLRMNYVNQVRRG